MDLLPTADGDEIALPPTVRPTLPRFTLLEVICRWEDRPAAAELLFDLPMLPPVAASKSLLLYDWFCGIDLTTLLAPGWVLLPGPIVSPMDLVERVAAVDREFERISIRLVDGFDLKFWREDMLVLACDEAWGVDTFD